MKRIPCSKVRMEFSDTINQVVYGHQRVVLERHGKLIAALVPIEDYEKLEALSVKEEKTET